jgi:hypothetical protein
MAKTETSDTGVASNDAYTGLLAISLIALIVGSVLLFLDYSQHSGTPPRLTGIPKFEAKKEEIKQPQSVPPGENKDGKDAVKDGKDAVKDGPKDGEAK